MSVLKDNFFSGEGNTCVVTILLMCPVRKSWLYNCIIVPSKAFDSSTLAWIWELKNLSPLKLALSFPSCHKKDYFYQSCTFFDWKFSQKVICVIRLFICLFIVYFLILLLFLLKLEQPDFPPRLFHCSNATGRFEVDEINNFTQDDLEEDDIMILDTYDQVFVWIGKDSNQKERKDAFTFAKVSLSESTCF